MYLYVYQMRAFVYARYLNIRRRNEMIYDIIIFSSSSATETILRKYLRTRRTSCAGTKH